MSGQRLTVAVLVAVAALLAVVALLEPGRSPPPAPAALTDRDPATVERLAIEHDGAETVRLIRQNGRWQVEAPYISAADGQKVDELLEVLHAPSYKRLAASSVELADLKLAPPLGRIVADDVSIDFGTTNPLNELRYVRTSEEVHLIPDLHYHHVIAGAAVWASRRLLPEGIELQAVATPSLRIERGESGTWHSAVGELSQDEADALAAAWQNVEARRVRSLEQRPSQGVIDLSLADGRALRYAILQREPELVLGREDLGLEFRLDGEQASSLLLDGARSDGAAP